MAKFKKLNIMHILTLALAVTTALPALSAEVYKADWPLRALVVLEGDIVEGDYERMENAVVAHSGIGAVFLGSQGGDLYEAMKIGKLLREHKWSTLAPPSDPSMLNTFKSFQLLKDDRNYICASSCFLIYAGGVERDGEALGLHRPYLTEETASSLSAEEAINFAKQAEQDTSMYLKEMDIPEKFAGIMFSTPSADLYMLKEDEVAGIDGLIPGLREWMDTRCNLSSPEEKNRLDKLWGAGSSMSAADEQFFSLMMDRMNKERDCKRSELTVLRLDALMK
jgi:hypothetical protein